MKATISKLYLLLGRELEELSEVKAGNIVGIGGLENYILKSATISTNVACTPFVEITQSAAPILRVAVEPELSSDLKALVSGLHLLNQADANVQVFEIKVNIFWEGHKMLQNVHLTFDWHFIGQG